MSVADLRYVAYAGAFGIAVNIALNLVFIPEYSYKGAAGMTVFSEALGFVLVYAVARRRTGRERADARRRPARRSPPPCRSPPRS